MVIKIGIEQITRSHWVGTAYEENWISAEYVNAGEPDQTHKIPKSEKRFNYGFNDFVVAEVTPELASSITGNMEEDIKLPPEHPRPYRFKTDPPVKSVASLLC
jgi:hypothetical protein